MEHRHADISSRRFGQAATSSPFRAQFSIPSGGHVARQASLQTPKVIHVIDANSNHSAASLPRLSTAVCFLTYNHIKALPPCVTAPWISHNGFAPCCLVSCCVHHARHRQSILLPGELRSAPWRYAHIALCCKQLARKQLVLLPY